AETSENESAEEVETEVSVKAEETVVNPQVIEELESDIAELETQLKEIEQQLDEVEQIDIPAGSILEFGNLSTNGNNITFTITDEKILEALEGYERTMAIDSSFASIEEDAEKNGVRNQATFNIGDKTLNTNTVVVAPHVETKVPERPEEPEPEEKPEQPEGPSEPEEKPEQPEGPSEPEEKPEQPEGPSEPEEKPEQPEGPSEPEEKPEQPEGPSEPEEKPEQPEGPSEPEEQLVKPEASTDSGNKSEELEETNTTSTDKQSEDGAALPDTGETQNNLLYVGSILALLAGGALLFVTRKKKNEDH